MLTLYFSPMACSLASRIGLAEAGVGAEYVNVDLASKEMSSRGSFLDVSAKGKVPVLRLEDATILTETPAILSCIADLAPGKKLAPPPGTGERYAFQEWLSFLGTELHKQHLYPIYSPKTDARVKEFARSHIDEPLRFLEDRLEASRYLMGDAFSLADAYLVWGLILAKRASPAFDQYPSLASYLARVCMRPAVAESIAVERTMLKRP